MKKLLFLVNVDWFFLSHRLPIAIEAASQGYEVHVATALTDKQDELKAYGFIVHPLTLGRSSLSIAGEARTFRNILQIYRTVRPDIVHLVTIKPVLFGGIAARITRVPKVVAAVSGLGYVFLAKGLKASFLRFLVSGLYRFALTYRNLTVVCQNPDDCKSLIQKTKISKNKIIEIPGSGVDLSAYTARPIQSDLPTVVMASRLLRDKGVCEFIDAAKILNQQGLKVRFWLAGELDPGNPASIVETDLASLRAEGTVEFLGHRSDISELFAASSIVVLPSYREGFPKVLIEAAACGRAVITTDVPGCRDAIVPGKTGLLVPVKDTQALAGAIRQLIENKELCKMMGKNGRDLAERRYSIEDIVSAHMKIYQDLERIP